MRWCMVRSPKAQVTSSGMKGLLVFFSKYDFYWINWTRADFAPQIQVNKDIRK